MTETMLITVYCIVDDFINAVLKTRSGQEAAKSWAGTRGPKPRLALAEIITLNILRFYFKIYGLIPRRSAAVKAVEKRIKKS